MKQLQNNFTTPEQSKRLLELGVPADSADCSIDEWGRVHKIPQDNGNLLFSQLKRQTIYTILPCWSVGRLIEIYNITTNLMPGMEIKLNVEPQNCTYIELVIAAFELAADDGLNDFSLLED